MKLASSVAAAGDGKPEKYFLFSISNFTLKRANLNAAQAQNIKAIIQPNFPKGFNAHTYITNAGAAPKDTISERLSYSAPKSLSVLVNLATLPSSPSKISAIKIAIAE